MSHMRLQLRRRRASAASDHTAKPDDSPAFAVLDTSALREDFHWTRGMASLLALASARRTVVCIPQVCQDELVSLFRREVEKHRGPLRRCRELLRQHLISDEDLDRTIPKYAEDLSARRDASGVLTLPYPEVAAQEIVQRVLAGKRPFKLQHDAGIRDYLIWKSVIDWTVRTDGHIVFVSGDSDFAADQGATAGLHPHLVEDLQATGQNPGRVILLRSIGDLIEMLLTGMDSVYKVVLDREPALAARLTTENLPALLNAYEEMIYAPEEYETLERVYEIRDPRLEILEIRALPNSTIAIVGEATYYPRWHYGDPSDRAVQNACVAKVQFSLDSDLKVLGAIVIDSWGYPEDPFTHSELPGRA